MRPCIYIDSSFFKLLDIKKQEHFRKLAPSPELKVILKVIDFIFVEGASVILCLDENDYNNNNVSELIRIFEDGHVQGKIELKITEIDDFYKELMNIGSKSPINICFITSPYNDIKASIEDTGYYCVCDSNIDDFISLQALNRSNYDVSKDGAISEWSDLSVVSHTFNAITIFDRYIFSKTPSRGRAHYGETIAQLIKGLLAQNSSKTVKILIATPKMQGHYTHSNLEALKVNIEKELAKLKTGKDISIGISLLRGKTPKNHDRLIFTNFLVLQSGDGFNYFKTGENSDIDTNLNACSLLDWQDFEAYLNKLKRLKKELPMVDKIGYEVCRAGHCDIELINTL